MKIGNSFDSYTIIEHEGRTMRVPFVWIQILKLLPNEQETIVHILKRHDKRANIVSVRKMLGEMLRDGLINRHSGGFLAPSTIGDQILASVTPPEPVEPIAPPVCAPVPQQHHEGVARFGSDLAKTAKMFVARQLEADARGERLWVKAISSTKNISIGSVHLLGPGELRPACRNYSLSKPNLFEIEPSGIECRSCVRLVESDWDRHVNIGAKAHENQLGA